MPRLTNLTCHLDRTATAPHELRDVMNHILLASKILSADINKAGLTDILGSAESENETGDEQKTLDVIGNEVFLEILEQCRHICAVGTEEAPELITYQDDFHADAQYIVFLDPVDGSSNIDVNVSIGTNFVIFRKPEGQSVADMLKSQSYLQCGRDAVAAGYLVYGASTMLVYSLGDSVHGFTLDPAIGEFVLSHPELQLPDTLKYVSLNQAYRSQWPAALREHVDTVFNHPDRPSVRYIGSLVSDFHRNLLKGGVYYYPANDDYPHGKLRLLYEGIPFAYLIEQAGGAGSNGSQPLLDIQPTDIHQRCELYLGHRDIIASIDQL